MERIMRELTPPRLIALVLLCLATNLVGCSSMTVEHTFSQESSFADLETFQVLPSKSIVDEDVSSTVEVLIGKALVGKGLSESDQQPDLIVTYDGWVDGHEQIYDRLGYAVETWQGMTTVYTVSRNVPVGVLTVHLIEQASGEVVYRAQGQAQLKKNAKPAERLSRLTRAIEKLFEPYPARD